MSVEGLCSEQGPPILNVTLEQDARSPEWLGLIDINTE